MSPATGDTDVLDRIIFQLAELQTTVARLEVALQGNGGMGIGNRVTRIEECLGGQEGIEVRLAVIEHKLERIDKAQWLILAVLVSVLVERIVMIALK
ncbi:hypothetical protein [Thermogutta sp.]|uniref:hypothetical protein n=1 Tax=Thermogutta sp. TaxID=1962930 RepID=UPI00322074FA